MPIREPASYLNVDGAQCRIRSGVRIRWREDSGFVVFRRQPDGRAVEITRSEDAEVAAAAYKALADFTYRQPLCGSG